jgi:hypothetical protein
MPCHDADDGQREEQEHLDQAQTGANADFGQAEAVIA